VMHGVQRKFRTVEGNEYLHRAAPIKSQSQALMQASQ